MTTMTVKMPEKLSARLRQEAAGRGMNCSELVRRAVEELLESGGERGEGTCLSVAHDLAGSLRGARDLSSNADHMKGFGR